MSERRGTAVEACEEADCEECKVACEFRRYLPGGLDEFDGWAYRLSLPGSRTEAIKEAEHLFSAIQSLIAHFLLSGHKPRSGPHLSGI